MILLCGGGGAIILPTFLNDQLKILMRRNFIWKLLLLDYIDIIVQIFYITLLTTVITNFLTPLFLLYSYIFHTRVPFFFETLTRVWIIALIT